MLVGNSRRRTRIRKSKLRVTDLELENGSYDLELFAPSAGSIQTQPIEIRNGELWIDLPTFTDDIVVHIYL